MFPRRHWLWLYTTRCQCGYHDPGSDVHLITTTRHLDTPPTDEQVAELTELLRTEVIPRARSRDGLRALAFLLPQDRAVLYSFTVWPDRETMLAAEVSDQHVTNSVAIEQLLGVTRPREQHHYEVLASFDVGTEEHP